jgi:hypothetical protein
MRNSVLGHKKLLMSTVIDVDNFADADGKNTRKEERILPGLKS